MIFSYLMSIRIILLEESHETAKDAIAVLKAEYKEPGAEVKLFTEQVGNKLSKASIFCLMHLVTIKKCLYLQLNSSYIIMPSVISAGMAVRNASSTT